MKETHPTVVALTHAGYKGETSDETNLQDSSDRIISLITEASKVTRRRTLFIEGIGKYRTGDTYYWALRTARENGWKIVALDRKKVADMLVGNRPDGKPNALFMDLELRRYIMNNIREKYWAQVLRRNRAGPTDIVVMHPGHIEGFLIESSIPKRNVRWIDSPKPVWGRLPNKELRRFKAKRRSGLTNRIKRKRQRT